MIRRLRAVPLTARVALAFAVLAAPAADHAAAASPVDAADARSGTDDSARPADPGEHSASTPVGAASIVDGANDAGFDMQRSLAASDPNVVVSPASLAVAFAMLTGGTNDPATARELSDVFGFGDGAATGDVVRQLLDELVPPEAAEGEQQTELAIADAVFAQHGAPVSPDFLDQVAADYGAEVNTVDFTGDPAAAADAINEWVAERTNDRIPEIVRPDAITPDMTLALANALYFQASWRNAFADDGSTQEPFTSADGSTTDVDMMHTTSEFAYSIGDDGTVVVSLPYADGENEMTVVMPDDLDAFMADLDSDSWNTIAASTASGEVNLSLPSFDVDTMQDISSALAEMGLTIPGGDYSAISPGLQIGVVLHGANLTVDELGTEGAAATVIMMPTGAAPGTEPDPLEITIDRPFYYAVRNVETGLILFSGQITDPTGS